MAKHFTCDKCPDKTQVARAEFTAFLGDGISRFDLCERCLKLYVGCFIRDEGTLTVIRVS